MAVRWRMLGAVLIGGALIASGAHANEAAHSLAERFAKDTAAKSESTQATAQRDRDSLKRKLQQEERLRADEAEMLERAKAEEAERRAAAQKAENDAKAAAEAERLAAERAEADRLAVARLAEQKAREEAEADKAARERAERETARIKAAEERRKAAEEHAARKLTEERAEAERQAQARKLAEEKAEADRRESEAAHERIAAAKRADEQRRMEAEREAEAKRLSEKLERARQQRAARDLGEGYSALGAPMAAEQPSPTQTRSTRTEPTTPTRAARQERTARARRGPTETRDAYRGARATVLLVMEPGSRGIRRREKTGDPIVCSGSTCFISEGAEMPAKAMSRARAFGPGNTLGSRAGACRHALACIFRDIDVGSETFALQAIDMRILRHDRREQVTVDVDHTCRLSANRLHCAEPVDAGSYRAWIVPETLARKAGPDALIAAIEAGLPPPPIAAGAWR